MRWSEVELHQPGLARLGRERLLDPGVVLVVTIRRDGTPRLSPVEPFEMDGTLWLSMMWDSKKAADLHRDSCVLVHSVITSPDGGEGEFKIRGTARAEADAAVQGRYARAVAESLGWDPQVGRFHLFEVDIEHVTYIRYDPVSEYQHVAMWPPPREFIRKHDTATTLADAEPITEILASAAYG
jgi:pyridoxamine 5'-phosphate oxidase-like protein